MKWLGFILTHIFRRMSPARFGRCAQRLAACLLAAPVGACLAGVEALGARIFYPDFFAEYAAVAPLRIIIYALLFAAAGLLFIKVGERNGESKGENAPPAEQETEIGATQTFADRITVRTGQKIKIIPVGQIIYVRADGDYVSICTEDGEYLKEQTMKHTESLLNPDVFVRVHRSHIVNINRISRIERYGEEQLLALHNGAKIKVSAARYQLLKQVLGL